MNNRFYILYAPCIYTLHWSIVVQVIIFHAGMRFNALGVMTLYAFCECVFCSENSENGKKGNVSWVTDEIWMALVWCGIT